MPDLSIVDAHLHLWDPARFPMPWLEGNPQLERPYGLADYVEQTAGLDIEAMVYVQVEVAPAYALLEAQWVADRARAGPTPPGHGDVRSARVRRPRTRLPGSARSPTAGCSRACDATSRARTQVDFASQPDFIRGAQTLAEFDLSCDLCLRHEQLASHIELVRACPDTRFMLDHLAKPNVKDHVRDPWWAQLAELAELPNVWCKISGIVNEADRRNWTAADLAPYIQHALDLFGEDRVVFGGDWPVVLGAASIAAGSRRSTSSPQTCRPSAKRKLFSENARRFYRLAP